MLRNVLRTPVASAHRSAAVVQKRRLMLQDHVGLSVLKLNGVPTFKFGCASTAEEAEQVAREIGGNDFALKAQVPVGGRNKGVFSSGFRSGIHMVYSAEEVRQTTEKMLGHRLVTPQTDRRGKLCRQVMVCERLFPRREYYFGITMDRTHNCPVVIGSGRGGVNIEDVAREDPDAIITLPVDVTEGLQSMDAEMMAEKMGFHSSCVPQAVDAMLKLYDTFIQCDCTLLEINPLSEDNHGRVFCVDCKMVLDDNAQFRQRRLFDSVDCEHADPMELRAAAADLNYIRLSGNIGCMVNGAGLAMATMDIIQLHGGSPANFLDIGGGATVDQVTEGFRIITADENVNAIIVNIFGGILRCDVIAQGIVNAVGSLNIRVPIVCRLQGTRQDDAHALIAASHLRVMSRDSLEEASQLVCKLASIVTLAKEASIDVNFELPI